MEKDDQYVFNKVLYAFESKGMLPNLKEKEVLIKKFNELKDEIKSFENLINRIEKSI